MKSSWAVILCKFSDSDEEPFPKQHYKDLFPAANVKSSWNMARYFADWSHGRLDLTGSKVFGWFKLSKSVADYNALGQGARPALVTWARAAAAANGHDLTPFAGVVVCTNLWHDAGSTTGNPATAGVIMQGKDTPVPMLLAHEMGHVYGLAHSRIDGSVDDYRDPWDIMSAATVHKATDPKFGPMGPGVNAANMRSRGWLDETRVWRPDDDVDDFDATVTLRPLVRHDLPGHLAAQLPDGTVAEFRVKDGWDQGIPRPAILVHRAATPNSYLVRGNSGSSDLVVGDSIGDEVDPYFSYQRTDVVAIDPAGLTAKLRIRRNTGRRHDDRTIDPMALILSGEAYLNWIELRHPHVPRVEDVARAMRQLTRAQRATALEKARALTKYGRTVEAAIAEVERSPGR